MFGALKTAFTAMARGRLQQQMGIQSPQLPTSLTHVGRFLYISGAALIGVCYYTGYVNARTAPGSGPTLLVPGMGGPATGAVSRPDPSMANNSGPGSVTGTAASMAGVTSGNFKRDFPSLVERTDQGVDFGGAPGNNGVRAMGNGTVLSVGLWPGWPGQGGIVIQYAHLAHPVYVMESFQVAVNPATGKPWMRGDTVRAGQLLGTVVFPGTGIEAGYTDPTGTQPLTPYHGRADGTAMPGGLAFRKLLGYN